MSPAHATPGSITWQARQMTEADLQARIVTMCARLGLLAYHTHDSRRSEAGFPDLVIAGHHGLLFAELKRQTGKVTAEQQVWLHRLAEAGADAYVWRPSDLLDGSIAWALAHLAHGDRARKAART